jgi:probable H4MPT-linked C1 transfer pathway protein
MNIIGLDIGGAHLKAADGRGRARTSAFPVWQRPGDLPGALAPLLSAFPAADLLAVTMTAELCDCFATRSEGVRAVLAGVAAAAPGVPARVWGTDGRFHDPARLAGSDPLRAAASNWLATATLAARLAPEGPGLFVDIGSTTTDLIALDNGNTAHAGRTDLDRLRTGELVYAGVRRTPLSALAHEVAWRGGTVGLAAERFATTHDLYLALGSLDEAPEDRDTADGRPATIACALGRIARMVGADRDTLDDAAIRELARELDRLLLARLVAAARRVLREANRDGHGPPTVVLAGSGGFLAGRLARALQPDPARVLDLATRWGPDASHAAAAHAVAVLAAEEARGDAEMSIPCPSPGPATLFKLGGSLLDWPGLPAALAEIAGDAASGRAALLVGGGAIVESLRDLDRLHGLGDAAAHALAMRALDLTAHVAAAMAPGRLVVVATPDACEGAWRSGLLPVLAPRAMLPDDVLPASWDVTSDTIAAHLAVRLGASRLVLLKSAPLPPDFTRADAARRGLVDPAFPAASAAIPTVLYRNLRDPGAGTAELPRGA